MRTPYNGTVWGTHCNNKWHWRKNWIQTKKMQYLKTNIQEMLQHHIRLSKLIHQVCNRQRHGNRGLMRSTEVTRPWEWPELVTKMKNVTKWRRLIIRKLFLFDGPVCNCNLQMRDAIEKPKGHKMLPRTPLIPNQKKRQWMLSKMVTETKHRRAKIKA